MAVGFFVVVVVDQQPYVIHFRSCCIGLSLHMLLIDLKFIFNLNLLYFTELKLITALKSVALNMTCAACTCDSHICSRLSLFCSASLQGRD